MCCECDSAQGFTTEVGSLRDSRKLQPQDRRSRTASLNPAKPHKSARRNLFKCSQRWPFSSEVGCGWGAGEAGDEERDWSRHGSGIRPAAPPSSSSRAAAQRAADCRQRAPARPSEVCPTPSLVRCFTARSRLIVARVCWIELSIIMLEWASDSSR